MKKLLAFHADCGRMGSLDGRFVLDEQEQAALAELYGSTISFGEVLGSIELLEKHITTVTDDAGFLDMAERLGVDLCSGFNPLSYADQDEDDDDDDEEVDP